MCKTVTKKFSILHHVFALVILLLSLSLGENVSAFTISVPTPSGGLKLLEKLNLHLPIYLKVDNDYSRAVTDEPGKEGARSISFLSVSNVSISEPHLDSADKEDEKKPVDGNQLHDNTNEMEFNTEGNENNINSFKNMSGLPEKRIFFYELGLNLTANAGEKPNCECGSVSNAFPAESIEFPWRVLLQKSESPQVGGFCSGSILDKSWIMTSARCLVNLAAGSPIYVNVGDYDLLTNTEMDNDIIRAESWIIHPQFNPLTNNNDIALIKLEREIIFRHNIQPICLPYRFVNMDLTGATVLTSGWKSFGNPEQAQASGHWKSFGKSIGNPVGTTNSIVMLKAETVYLTTIQCRNLIGIEKAETISNNVICSYGHCVGDPGGSLDFYDMETKRYFGLGISIGQTCSPLLYTKVTNYLQFIQQVTNEVFCVK